MENLPIKQNPTANRQPYVKLATFFVTATLILSLNKTWTLTSDQLQPYHMQADQFIYNYKQHTMFYEGNVHAQQGSTQVTSDNAVVYTSKKNNIITLIIATGQPAHYSTLPDKGDNRLFAEANTIKYFPQKNQVLLLMNAKVTQGKDLFTGPHIWYDVSKRVVISTNPQGQGETTVVIEPQKK